MRNILYSLALFTLAFTASPQSYAQEKPVPDFISISKHEANVRAGPGTQYPILWVYKQKGYPLEVLAKYQSWYKTRDAEGEEGWVYKSLVSKRRTVLINQGEAATLYKNSDATKPLLRLAPRVILSLDKCTRFMCQVSYRKTDGWILKERLSMLNKEASLTK